jgi:hypothetical protein
MKWNATMTVNKPRKQRKSVPADEADVDPRPILERLEREPIMVVEGGKRKRVPVLEALVLRQFAAGMKGSSKAVRQIIKLAQTNLRLPQDLAISIVAKPNESDERTPS